MPVHSFAGVKEVAINWLKQDVFHSPKEKVAELLIPVLAEGELSAHPSAALWNGGKKISNIHAQK